MIDRSFFDTIHERRNTGSIKYKEVAHNIIPMWVADMDFQSPPPVIQALTKAAQHGIYGYGDIDEEYDSLIRDWYSRRSGWQIEKEQIMKVPGVKFGIAAALRAVTRPGDAVLICQPGYYPLVKLTQANGRLPIINELVLKNGRYEIDFDDFEAKIKENQVKAFLLCSPHNPVGRVWSREELLQMAELCLKYGVYIISDEIHSDFIYPGYKHIPMASLSEDIAQITITCVSPTKTFNLAGLQAANMIVPNQRLRADIEQEYAATGYGELNIMAAAAAAAAYREGEEWLNTLLLYLQENIALVQAAFPEEAAICALPQEGTYLTWLDCRRLDIPYSQLDEVFLKEAGVWLHNGEIFGSGGEGFMRMNIACPRSVLEEALSRMRKCIG